MDKRTHTSQRTVVQLLDHAHSYAHACEAGWGSFFSIGSTDTDGIGDVNEDDEEAENEDNTIVLDAAGLLGMGSAGIVDIGIGNVDTGSGGGSGSGSSQFDFGKTREQELQAQVLWFCC